MLRPSPWFAPWSSGFVFLVSSVLPWVRASILTFAFVGVLAGSLALSPLVWAAAEGPMLVFEGLEDVPLPVAVLTLYARDHRVVDEDHGPAGGVLAPAALERFQESQSLEDLGRWRTETLGLDLDMASAVARAELVSWAGQQGLGLTYEMGKLMEAAAGEARPGEGSPGDGSPKRAERELPPSERLVARAEGQWRALLREHQRRHGVLSRPLVERLGWTLDRLHQHDPEAVERLVDLAQEVQRQPEGGWDLYADVGRGNRWFGSRAEALRIHLEREPGQPVLLAHLAHGAEDLYSRAALYRMARGGLARDRNDALAMRWAAMHALTLAAVGLVEQGRRELLPAFSTAPQDDGGPLAPGWLEALGPQRGTASVAGFNYQLTGLDLRREVAALMTLSGHPSAARALLDAVEVPPEIPLLFEDRASDELQAYLRHLLVERRLAHTGMPSSTSRLPVADDPFSLFATWADTERLDEGAALWSLLAAQDAETAGYGTYQRYFLTRAAMVPSPVDGEGFLEEQPTDPPSAARRTLVERVHRQTAELAQDTRQRALEHLDEARAVPGTAVVLASLTLESQLSTLEDLLPVAVRFIGGAGPSEMPEGEADGWILSEKEAEEALLPEGFRSELSPQISGDHMAWLVQGSGTDGGHGLHLLRSPDGGATWPERYDLTAVMDLGFGLAPVAEIHRLGGERVELVVQRNWAWEGLQLPRESAWAAAQGHTLPFLRLEVDLDEMLQDRDGDGWTDARERLLGLDPHSRDSDADGLEDREDPMPRTALSHYSLEGEVFAVAQGQLVGSFSYLATGSMQGFAADQRSPELAQAGAQILLHPGLGLGSLRPRTSLVDFDSPEAMRAAGLEPMLHGESVVHLVAVSHDGLQAQVLAGWQLRVTSQVRLAREPGGEWQVTDGATGSGCIRYRLGSRHGNARAAALGELGVE